MYYTNSRFRDSSSTPAWGCPCRYVLFKIHFKTLGRLFRSNVITGNIAQGGHKSGVS